MRIKKLLLSVTLATFFIVAFLSASKNSGYRSIGDLQTGDLIFQTSQSELSLAIQLATHSKYSHCGLIYREGDKYFVLEAVQPVQKTPLDEWIARGEDAHYVIKRLKNSQMVLTPEMQQKMKTVGNSFIGKDYDIYYEWSDEKIYCSELVWKIYKRTTGLEIGKLEQLRDFDLSNARVKKEIYSRYGQNIPYQELVISPGQIFGSELLTTVSSN